MINSSINYKKDENVTLIFSVYKSSRNGEKIFIPKGEAVLIEDIITNLKNGDVYYKLKCNKITNYSL